jgi:2-alkyl-3-oxoalkanoate reductase
MRVFVAGATGAVGSSLVPVLVEAGHDVVGMTRSQDKVDALRAASAEPMVADGLDRDAVLDAVRGAKPEVVVHELTALPASFDIRRFDRTFEMTNRLRTEGNRQPA